MYTKETQVAVYPFSRQVEGEEIVIGRVDTGVFLALPPDAVEILDSLAQGKTVGEAQDLYLKNHGEVPDVEDLLQFLQSKGFVRPSVKKDQKAEPAPPAPGPASAPVPAADAEPPQIRYHFTNVPQSLAERLFGRTSLTICAFVMALAGLVALREPSLVPGRDALYFSEHSTFKTLLLILMGYTTVFIHEMGHLLAARAAGVPSRLGIGHRMWILVAETDMTGLWSVPKRKRYLPMLAGPLIDVVSASAILLLLFAESRRWIALPGLVHQLCAAMFFVYMMRLLWQCFFFVRTDFYYVIATFFGCKSLMRDTQVFLGNQFRRLFSGNQVDQSRVPKSEMRVIRAYAWVWLIGRINAFIFLFFVTIPVATKYLQSSSGTLLSGFSQGSYAFFDALFVVIFYIVPLGIGFGLWIRSMTRRWRQGSARAYSS